MTDILKLSKGFAVGSAVLILLLIAIFWVYPRIVTDSRLNEALDQVTKMDQPPLLMEMDVVDGWDRPIHFKLDKTPKKLTYIVRSNGADGEPNTEDDFEKTRVDLNVSRIIGEWAAPRAKEFLKGLKDGLSTKSKHE